jgi:tetratricopeptide (TPR) repeat protein
MRRRGLARAAALAGAAALISLGGIAIAQQDEPQRAQQAQEREWTACVNSGHAVSRDAAIAGCTRLIEAGEGTRSALAGAHSNRGIAYQEKGDLDRAIADYTEALHLNPRYSTAFVNRGKALQQKGELDRALADYNEAIRFDPDQAMAFNNRGTLYQQMGDLRHALADFEEAIKVDPRNVFALNNHGNLAAARGDVDRAIADYSEAIRIDPAGASAFVNRGNAYQIKADLEHAIADYSEAFRIDPTNAVALNNRGNTYQRRGEFERAVADYSEAIRIEPGYAGAINNRGLAHFNTGDYGRSASDFARALEGRAPDPYRVMWLYLARSRAGDERAGAELDANAMRLPASMWPYPVIEFYLGRRTLAATMAAADGAADRCTAEFFIGEWELLKAERSAAIESLKAAASTCPRFYAEYRGALAELKRLGE